MEHPRRFRFGVKLRRAASGQELAAQAQRAEDLGYSSLLLADHVWDQLAPLPAAAAAAALTRNIRVGTQVLCNDFRHPVMLAKEAATLDRLSGGRLELGLGAGWRTDDYLQAGLSMASAAERIAKLEEAIDVVLGLFAPEPLDYRGRHYRVRGLVGTPSPVQRPAPPLSIGGGGRKILSLAARRADIVGINPVARSGVHDEAADRDASPDATDRKLNWVREAAGERFPGLELQASVHLVAATGDRSEDERLLLSRYPLPVSEAREVPHAWVGSQAEIAESLERRRERWGISYWVLGVDHMETLAPVVELLNGR
ncbi:TIGR03621 family F420-dependent LLM class oxidoreductase [Myxococcota bacterium]|nr:TIGR03621 family F420-dependent LLM class oxidoreductase [Myxococcota bacterium]